MATTQQTNKKFLTPYLTLPSFWRKVRICPYPWATSNPAKFSLTRPQRFLLSTLLKEILWKGIKRTRHWGLVSLTSCCFCPRDSLRGLSCTLFISGHPPSMMWQFMCVDSPNCSQRTRAGFKSCLTRMWTGRLHHLIFLSWPLVSSALNWDLETEYTDFCWS